MIKRARRVYFKAPFRLSVCYFEMDLAKKKAKVLFGFDVGVGYGRSPSSLAFAWSLAFSIYKPLSLVGEADIIPHIGGVLYLFRKLRKLAE